MLEKATYSYVNGKNKKPESKQGCTASLDDEKHTHQGKQISFHHRNTRKHLDKLNTVTE